MMTRRAFLRRTSLALPALLVGDAALEAFERLTHRKVFALGRPMPRAGLVGYHASIDFVYSKSVTDRAFLTHQWVRVA